MIRIALLHDLGEARVGDITPHDGVNPTQKHALARAGMGDLSQFFASAEKAMESPGLRALLAELQALRPSRSSPP